MIGRIRWHLDAVASTQDIAFKLAELGAPHGTVVRAEYQSAGRGRQGRSWHSQRGSALMFSVILRPTLPPHQLGHLSILVANTVVDALAELIGDSINLKWPNDILIRGKETSGILLQSRHGADPVLVAGIGINIDSPSKSLPPEATCLNRHSGDPVDTDDLLSSILDRMDGMWTSLQAELDPDEITRLESRLWLLDESVSIIDADREIRGRILGLARNGGLRLSIGGREQVVVAGEIRRGPRPIDSGNTV